MIGFYLAAAVVLLSSGIVLGALAVVCLGIHREDRDGSLLSECSSPMLRGARRLNGVYTRRAVPARDPIRRPDS